MANPLFQALGGNQNAVNPIVQQIIGFKNQFQGDPHQKVQELLNSGKMTQEQCNCSGFLGNDIGPTQETEKLSD